MLVLFGNHLEEDEPFQEGIIRGSFNWQTFLNWRLWASIVDWSLAIATSGSRCAVYGMENVDYRMSDATGPDAMANV